VDPTTEITLGESSLNICTVIIAWGEGVPSVNWLWLWIFCLIAAAIVYSVQRSFDDGTVVRSAMDIGVLSGNKYLWLGSERFCNYQAVADILLAIQGRLTARIRA